MKDLEIPLDELSPNQLIIQWFNQHGQRALGKVMLKLFNNDMKSNAVFHVIDAEHNLQYVVKETMAASKCHDFFDISSMLQVLQKWPVKAVITYTKPFTIVEAHYDDAWFYLKDASLKDALPIHGM